MYIISRMISRTHLITPTSVHHALATTQGDVTCLLDYEHFRCQDWERECARL